MVVGICDDTLEMRVNYEKMFSRIFDEEGIIGTIKTYKSGDQILFDMDEVIATVDILFLDVNMPGTQGVETAKKLRDNGYGGEIIFLTYSKDSVFEAFDVSAFNYVVKDITPEKKIKRILLDAVKSAEEKKSEYIILSGVGEHRSVAISKISYFEIIQKIVTVYYDDDSFEFVSTMGKLETQLYNKGFLRVSRSYLVSISHIASFSYEKVVMKTGETLPVGRKYYKELKAQMTKQM